MLDCLDDLGLGKVAAGCLRSILLNSPTSPADEAITRHLFLPLVRFVLGTGPDPENSRSLIAHALPSFAATLPTTAAPATTANLEDSNSSPIAAAFGILIPMLLTQASASAEPNLFPEVAARLLDLAGADPTSFRNAVASMTPDQKGFMEEVLRAGGAWAQQSKKGDGGIDGASQGGEHSIALKLDFGG